LYDHVADILRRKAQWHTEFIGNYNDDDDDDCDDENNTA
jgi:hypothetical protein